MSIPATGPAGTTSASTPSRATVGLAIPSELITRLVHGAVCSPGAPRRAVVAPFDGSVLAEVPQSSEADVDLAFRTSRQSQPRWAATSLSLRKRIMLRFHDLLLARREEGLDIVQAETGKARRDALDELLDVCVQARHYSRHVARLLAVQRVPGVFPVLTRADIHHQPVGVVGIISPWNFPLTIAISDAIPALLAGNTVVLKPDSQTPLTALWVADLLYQAGLPPRTLQVILGPGSVLGPQMIARSDFMMFTGSTKVGRDVAAECGRRLIGCSLELGGKNPMIVCADADIQRAAEIATRACFGNTGQLCVSVERIYVVNSVYERFREEFLGRVNGLRLVNGLGWGADMGSLASAAQLATVAEHVADAVAKGATVQAGGRARPDIGPCFFEPTVLSGVVPGMTVYAEETFGPVVSLYPVPSEVDAVAAANDSQYGLNASVITGDPEWGRRLGAQLRAGTVNVNEGYAAAWGSVAGPLGGMRDSGLGRRHGDYGLLKYTEPQTIATQRFLGFGPQFGMDNRSWGRVLVAAVRTMKEIGLR